MKVYFADKTNNWILFWNKVLQKKDFINPKKRYILATAENKKSILKRIVGIILGFGPGIFAIGYTIGTGSVNSMIVAESKFGIQLL